MVQTCTNNKKDLNASWCLTWILILYIHYLQIHHFVNSSSMISKPFVLEGAILNLGFLGIPSPDPHRCSVSLSGCHLWISSQSSIQSEKIGWSLTCHQCYKPSKILVQFFWAEIPQSHKVTWSDVKMLNSLIVFLGFFNLGSERERGYAEPVWRHFGRD